MTANGEHRFGKAYTEAMEHEKNQSDIADILTDDATFSIMQDMPRDETLGDPLNIPAETFRARMQAEVIATGSISEASRTTLLDAPDTSPPNRSKQTYRARFMRGKEAEYDATTEAYRTIGDDSGSNHFRALEDCRKFAEFVREKTTGEVKVMGSSCRDRWCPMCAGQKASYAKEQTEIYLKAMKAPRMLTLTLRNNDSDLKSQMDFLTLSFRTLRQRAYWKRHVKGGIWFLQIKRAENSGFWHPHLHVIIDGEYMEQHRLSELWEQVTFGSPVIDIRRINDIEYTAKYVARYTARPAKLADMPLVDRIEVILSLFRKRMCGTFGTGKTVTLTPPKIENDSEWSSIGWYDTVMAEARKNPNAMQIVKAYFNDEIISEDLYESYTGMKVNQILEPYEPPPPVQILLDFFQPK